MRHRLQFLALVALARLVRMLPLDFSARWAGKLARFLAPRLSPKRHQLALRNLSLALPHKSEAERNRICLEHWENLGRVVVEAVQIDRVTSDPSRIEIVGQHVLERYRGKLGPAIGVSLHMGNWELAGWPLVALGAEPGAVYRALENPLIDQYMLAQRRTLLPGGLFGRSSREDSVREDLRTARRVTDFVRQGGRLGIVCDQHYARGVPVRFFGRTISAQPLAAIIARRIGARVWIARCQRIGAGSRFRIEFKELKVPRSSNAAADVQALLASIHRQFEEWIRESPGQWIWSSKHWG